MKNLGYISTIANPGNYTTPVGPAAAFYTWAAPRVLHWLGGHRNTEDLVAGVSFPGYDSQGNPVDWEDIYQFADYFWPDQEIPPEERNVAMQPLRLFIMTPEGIQTGRADYDDQAGIWFPPDGIYQLYDFALKNGEWLQEVYSVEEAEAIKQGLQEPVPFTPPALTEEGVPVPTEETSGSWLWLGIAGLAYAGRKWLGF